MHTSKPKRMPAVAGMFYESDPQALRAQIEWAFKHELGPGELPKIPSERRRLSAAFICPHAGYMYSGPIAAHAYYQIAIEGGADTFIIIGPNHTGLGTLVSIMPKGVWVTPLGEVEIDEELASEILKNSEYADPDEKAHMLEHSVEVQVPFLQYLFNGRFKIVPIVVYEHSLEVAKDLANAIIKAIKTLNRDVVLIASSDFTHYEPHDVAVSKDSMAIKAIEELNVEKFERIVTTYNLSICGPGPIMVAMIYSKNVGCKHARLLKYATSGDVTGEKAAVVGYAAIQFPIQ